MKIFCVYYALQIAPIQIQIKAKINVSVPSGVKRKSTDFYIKRFLLLVHSVVKTKFDDSIKNQTSNTWISWSNMQMLYFSIVPRKGDVWAVNFNVRLNMMWLSVFT